MMDIPVKLTDHLKNRVTELKKKQNEGQKIIGYTPGGYLPEELVYAAGAIPVGLIRGGEHEPVLYAGAFIPRWLDTFCRAQVGYKMLGEEPVYQMVDLLAVPLSDNNIRAVADCWDFYTDTEVFRFGVPHEKSDFSFDYYLGGLHSLKNKLEIMTGNKITDSNLKESIDLCNRERELFREISLMRKSDQPPINAKDFVALNHDSFQSDKHIMVEALESIRDQLKKQDDTPSEKRPRVLLTGSTLACGDNKILHLIEEAGADVVIEEFAEGIRPYWETVQPNGDLMEALADGYFRRRVPPAWFRPGRERLEFLIKLAKEFRVDGVIWYQTMYRDAYDFESYYFPDMLKKETGLTMLKIESDYDASEIGPFRTRIETFVETIRR